MSGWRLYAYLVGAGLLLGGVGLIIAGFASCKKESRWNRIKQRHETQCVGTTPTSVYVGIGSMLLGVGCLAIVQLAMWLHDPVAMGQRSAARMATAVFV